MDVISFEEFKRMDLRIALVKKVAHHPNADKLYVLTIDVGGQEKVIVAGIKNFYKPEELENKKIVVINNLQPSLIRGIESNGMLLACKDKNTLAILVPERDVEVGSGVS
jgi:methionyl-tRNA synthetase